MGSTAGVDIESAPKWEVAFQCQAAAALAEHRPKAVTAAWRPGCGPGAQLTCLLLIFILPIHESVTGKSSSPDVLTKPASMKTASTNHLYRIS